MNSELKKYPLVSIVTPTYNHAEYLAETIESILSQTYPSIEYIVINDGSTDGTQEVLDLYSDRLISITQKNIGQSATLNKGWAMAEGEYIGYLSSDDILYPEAISSLVNLLLQNTEVGVAYGDFDVINQQSRFLKSVESEEFSKKRLVEDLVCQPGLGVIFKKELFDMHGGWNEDLRQVPDFDFWLRLSKTTSFKRVGVILGGYRLHEGSASFIKMPTERADEIFNVVIDFWGDKPNRKSISKAYLLSAKNHFQSRRFGKGLINFIQVAKYDLSKFMDVQTWRILFVGVFRRFYYFFKN